ncbi:MAG: dTMP kinase [Candidatus Bathyarchaeota archaeon]|nr:dTMP kinase [Candidatus Bathyarchaeota archaeon]
MCTADDGWIRKMVKKKGAFICIEGLDGSGKTTQAKLLVKKLKKTFDVIYTSEPSKGLIGTFIRKSYLYSENRLSPFVEALLFAADRIEHVKNEIIPALNKGKIVISDRYVYSSLAYQGAGEVSLDWIQEINKKSLSPDLAIFIDVDPEKVFCRLNSEKSVMETLETQQKVRELYLKFVEEKKLILINGDNSKNRVAEELVSLVNSFLENF